MVGCPVIINHEDVNDKNVNELRVGTISRVWFNELDGWYHCEGIITDEQAVDLIKNQGWNVSCSYNFVSDNTKKMYHGKEIDMEFIDGEFLHLAIVEKPRYEGANIVVNSLLDSNESLKKEIKNIINKNQDEFIEQNISKNTKEFINELRKEYGSPKRLKGIVKIKYEDNKSSGGEYIDTELGSMIVIPDNESENIEDITHEFAHALYKELTDDNKKNIKNSGMSVVKQFELDCDKNRVVFNIRCFPTHMVGDKRLYILNATERENYIRRVLSHCIDVETVGETRSARYAVKGNKSLTFCDFSGIGTIKNHSEFMDIIRHGIGKCKCYGAGMILFKGVN